MLPVRLVPSHSLESRAPEYWSESLAGQDAGLITKSSRWDSVSRSIFGPGAACGSSQSEHTGSFSLASLKLALPRTSRYFLFLFPLWLFGSFRRLDHLPFWINLQISRPLTSWTYRIHEQ